MADLIYGFCGECGTKLIMYTFWGNNFGSKRIVRKPYMKSICLYLNGPGMSSKSTLPQLTLQGLSLAMLFRINLQLRSLNQNQIKPGL